MARKTPTQLLKNLKNHLDELSEGNHSASEVASSLNDWARESAEIIKVRVHEEVESAALRMGFIKREEFDALLARVENLEAKKSAPKRTVKRPSLRKSSSTRPAKKAK